MTFACLHTTSGMGTRNESLIAHFYFTKLGVGYWDW